MALLTGTFSQQSAFAVARLPQPCTQSLISSSALKGIGRNAFSIGRAIAGRHASPSIQRSQTLKILSHDTSKSAESLSYRQKDGPTPRFAVIMEVEGVLADIHKYGHRNAFNAAFRTLGLECAAWTESVYTDLLRQAGSNDEEMVRMFFQKIGWPVTVPSKEYGAFVKTVIKHKKAELEAAIAAGKIPLRPGVDKFLDELQEGGLRAAILAVDTKCGEVATRLLLQRLGPERAAAVVVVGQQDMVDSDYGQLTLGGGAYAGVEEALAAQVNTAVAAEKQKVAKEVASMLRVSVELDTGSTEGTKRAVAALRAAAEMLGVPSPSCVLLAGSHAGSQAAISAGMVCIVLRSSITMRAEFPQARAVMDSFGPGALTLARLTRFVESRLPART